MEAQKELTETMLPSSQNLFRQLFKINEIGPICAIILLITVLGILQPRFYSLINILNVARQRSFLCIIAPRNLYRGQRQSVVVGRAVYWEGKILIFDEPTNIIILV